MLGSAYVKDNEIYLHYGEDNIGHRTGLIYPLGFHLANTTWFDVEYVDSLYKFLITFILSPQQDFKEATSFIDKLSEIIDNIDQHCCYLHFYTQALVKIMLDLPTKGVDAICNLNSVATNSGDKIYELFEFCNDTLPNVSINETLSFYRYIGEQSREILINDLKQKRKILNDEFAYMIDEKESLEGLSPKQKLFVLDIMQNREYYTKNDLCSQYRPNKAISPYISVEEQLKIFMLENDVDIVQMYNINTIDDLIRFELLSLVDNQTNIKKCKHCGYFFVPTGRPDTIYCNRINKGEVKPCNEIGAMEALKDKRKDNPVSQACDSVYQRFYSARRNNRMGKSDFNNLSLDISKLRDEYLDKPDEIDEFNDKLQQLKDFYEPKVSYKVKRKKGK